MQQSIKIVFLGKSNAGKTALITRFLEGFFGPRHAPTIGVAYTRKDIEVDGTVVALNIWDTAGQERFEAISKIYYRDAQVAIVCYDITDAGSYERAELWVEEIRTSEPDTKIFLVGTKVDLLNVGIQRAVEQERAQRFARERLCAYIETSSKTGENVNLLFVSVARLFLKAANRGNEEQQNRLDVSGIGKGREEQERDGQQNGDKDGSCSC